MKKYFALLALKGQTDVTDVVKKEGNKIIMDKKLKIILVIIVSVVLMGIIVCFVVREKVGYTIIKNGYSSYESKIISTYQGYEEFANYIDNDYRKVDDFNTNKYSEKYFDSKSLAIINISTGSGMDTFEKIDISIKGNSLICKASINYAKGPKTADVNGKLLLVEIDKSVTDFRIENNKL